MTFLSHALADDLTAAAPDSVGGLNLTDCVQQAADSGIDLSVLDVAVPAMDYISTMAAAADNSSNTATKRATFTAHLVFPWYKQLVPTTGGQPTPDWSTEAHLAFANTYGIAHTVLANSAPQANVFFGDRLKTIALARLINLCTAAVAALYPNRFNFFAVVPLPYVDDAIAEAKYALDYLGAVGITTLTNHEGLYLGNPQLKPFFQYLNSRPGKTIVYIHPTAPYLKVNGNYVEANPTVYITGIVEFYFETARCLMDLTWTQTLQNFTNIQYISAHVGGAFPSILDRMIKSVPNLEAQAKAIYKSRIWWDSAGPTYPNQVKGLQGYDIPVSQLVFGSDFPYAPSFTYAGSIAGLENDPNFTPDQIQNILTNNSRALFGDKIRW
ncbi:hypothetical protein FRB99_001270 [Tulasnella sp. 403]|nr:hypothetical protein FRB99_001270 [Tulasnella sp. 403]